MQRGLKNTFRFGPGFGTCARTEPSTIWPASTNWQASRAKTVVQVHEDGLFGSGLAKVMQQELPKLASRSWRRCRFHALARSVQRGAAPALAQSRSGDPQHVLWARPSSWRAHAAAARAAQGRLWRAERAASNLRFVKEFPEAADKIMDCNHWYDPRKPAAVDTCSSAASPPTRLELQHFP